MEAYRAEIYLYLLIRIEELTVSKMAALRCIPQDMLILQFFRTAPARSVTAMFAMWCGTKTCTLA
jgi:hypothetical protein